MDVLTGMGVVARVDVVVEVAVEAVVELEERFDESEGASFSLIVLDTDRVDETDALYVGKLNRSYA